MTLWAYNAMVKPMITYGSIFWGHRAAAHESKLIKVQRLAMLLSTNVVRSTPTAGLEVILGLPPLHNHIQKRGLASFVPLDTLKRSWDGLGTGNKRGHYFKLNQLANSFGVPDVPLDLPRNEPIDNPAFLLTYNVDEIITAEFTVLFTSKVGPTFHGWSFVVLVNSIIIYSRRGQSSSWATPPQTAAWALMAACRYIIDHNCNSICFISDSRALISLLHGPYCGSSTLYECWSLLNSIATNSSVQVSLDASHSHPSWHSASDLANLALSDDFDPSDDMPVKPAAIKQLITTKFTAKWEHSWLHPDPRGFQYRQTRRFWPNIDLNTSKQLLKLDRPTLSRVIQLCTGHGYNAYHLSLVDPARDGECRFCLEDTEDSWHIVNECPAFDWLRRNIAESGDPTPFSTTYSFNYPEDVSRLLAFTRVEALEALFTPPGTEQMTVSDVRRGLGFSPTPRGNSHSH